MKELPKELTAELLSLVLDEIIVKIFPIGFRNIPNEIEYAISKTMGKWVNIDTLTRLMKEWCYQQGISLAPFKTINYPHWTIEIHDEDGYELMDGLATEFEAVLKATHWVATEKGLLTKDNK